MINVQFADETEAVVVSYFGGPQDPAVWPNQGQIDETDPRFVAFRSAVAPGALKGLPGTSPANS